MSVVGKLDNAKIVKTIKLYMRKISAHKRVYFCIECEYEWKIAVNEHISMS